MKTFMIAAAAFFAAGLASAQSTLMEPNNSAGSPLDTPPHLAQPEPPRFDSPSRTDSALWAFETLDKKQRGYVTQSDVAVLPGQFSFYEADRNHDGRLDAEEFQRFWSDYQSGSD